MSVRETGGELATAAINRTTVVVCHHPSHSLQCHCHRHSHHPPPTLTTTITTYTTTTPTTTTPLPALSFSRRRSASGAASALDASGRTTAGSAPLPQRQEPPDLQAASLREAHREEGESPSSSYSFRAKQKLLNEIGRYSGRIALICKIQIFEVVGENSPLIRIQIKLKLGLN